MFDAKPNNIRLFYFRIKEFLYASNIDFSDILETSSYFDLPSWNIKPLMQLGKKDASTDQQFFMEIGDRYRDYISVYTGGAWDGNYVACVVVFPPDTVMFMGLPD